MMTSVYQPSSYGSSKLINGSNGEKFDSKQPEGSSLKCLEDPSFEFDTTPKSSQMKPSYRVLEDPMMTSIYEPSTVATSQPTRYFTFSMFDIDFMKLQESQQIK